MKTRLRSLRALFAISLTMWLTLSSMTLAVLFLSPPTATAQVVIDWLTVGDPGNACDTQPQGCFGGVAENYRIAKFEITNAQYNEFLNAVAESDPNALYNGSMGTASGGIARSGTSGGFSYATIAGRENWPVNWVSFWDALRLANWLHNGQPTGAQDNASTEDGAYTITLAGISANSVARNAGAAIFLTSEDEWYKAAYYDPVSMSYLDYPAASNTPTACTTPGAAANTANCLAGPGSTLSDVGSYTASASPNGTFDQGGNVREWNEAITASGSRGLRGGGFGEGGSFNLPASSRFGNSAGSAVVGGGFRLASLAPTAPPVPSLAPLSVTLLATLMGAAAIRRLRA